MENPKLIGLVRAWGQEEWIRLAVKQALEYCDEVMAVVTSFTQESKKFEDNTYDICKEYPEVKLLDIQKSWPTVSKAGANILNYMLQNSKLFLPGNWVWQLDSDEFYPESMHKEIRSIMKEGEDVKIVVEERYFFINMQHYLKGDRANRLMKVKTGKEELFPTSRWSRKDRNTYRIPGETGLFHYSLLRDMRQTRVMWLTEYPKQRQRGRNHGVKWIDEIYLNYDLENEDYWNKKNLEIVGRITPNWDPINFVPDENGRLFRYKGKHPKIIEEAGLPKIKDFRKWYSRI